MDHKEKALAVLEEWRHGISGSKLVREVAAKAEAELLERANGVNRDQDDTDDSLTRSAADEHIDLVMLEVLGRHLGGHYWIARGAIRRINDRLDLKNVSDPEVMGEVLHRIQIEELCAAFQMLEGLPQ